MYQDAYDHSWNRRETHVNRLAVIEWRRNEAAATTTNNNHTLPKVNEDHTKSTDIKIGDDIRELLSSFINPKYLDNEDFFVVADTIIEIRDVI